MAFRKGRSSPCWKPLPTRPLQNPRLSRLRKPRLLQALPRVLRPRLGVMSLGWQNRFHFPRAEVLERYARRGIRVLRTDLDGAVTVTVGADGGLRLDCARLPGCRRQ